MGRPSRGPRTVPGEIGRDLRQEEGRREREKVQTGEVGRSLVPWGAWDVDSREEEVVPSVGEQGAGGNLEEEGACWGGVQGSGREQAWLGGHGPVEVSYVRGEGAELGEGWGVGRGQETWKGRGWREQSDENEICCHGFQEGVICFQGVPGAQGVQ